MTNQNNTSPSPNSPREPLSREQLRKEYVEKQVAAHPFKALLHLPPEEVLDLFRSRVGQALLEGLSEWKRRVASELLSDARRLPHGETVDKMYVSAGIDEVCTMLIELPREVKRYLDATKRSR